MQRKAMVYVGKAFDQAEKIILQHDGAMIANYGQSVLVRMGDEGLQALGKAGHRVRELPEQPMAQIAGFKLNAAVPSGLSTSVEAAKRALPSGRSHHIVHLAGPMHPDWKDKLERMGVIFHQNMGDDRYLVSVDSTKVDGMQVDL